MASAAATGRRGATATGGGPGTAGWGRSSWHPRLRAGSYFPSFLEPRRRSEQALVAVVQEADVNGVWTGKVDRLVEALGLAGVARIRCRCRGCAVAWMSRSPRSGNDPGGRLPVAVVGRQGGEGPGRRSGGAPRPGGCLRVDQAGQREGIGLDVGAAETEAFWREFLRSLVRRGLAGVQLVSPTPTRASSKPSPKSSAPRGSAAPSTSSVTPRPLPKTSSSWSGRPSARSCAPTTSRRPGGCWPTP
jgi:hypothetical protein